MDITKLLVILLIFVFIGLTLPQISDQILNQNSTSTSSPAYPLLRSIPYFLIVAGTLMFIYWAYEEHKK